MSHSSVAKPGDFAKAINEALREEMARDENIILMGEGISPSLYGFESGLKEIYPERVLVTPISESGFVGAAIGAAMAGLRAYVWMTYNDFLAVAMDQIVNHAAKLRFMSGGQLKVPVVIMSLVGAGRGSGAQHSQSFLSYFLHTPGLKVVAPSTPFDAKGLLKTALRDDNCVIFSPHALCIRDVKGLVPKEEYTIPFGVADIKKEGKDVTVVATLYMVHKALAAARRLEERGISVEVIDPRTITPLDEKTILDSVRKTGRLVIVEEEVKRGGVGAEIAAMVVEEAFDYLDAPIKRLGMLFSPVSHNVAQEEYVTPNESDIIKAVDELTQ